MDSSYTINSFVLEGPVVSPPEVENGAHLPVGKQGRIIAAVKPRIAVGEHSDTLVLKGLKADGDSIVRKITLKIKVHQEQVDGKTSASLEATKPALTADTTKTNATKVTLKARAAATDIDGVKTIWYQITDNPNPTIVTPPGDGAHPNDGDANWTKLISPNDIPLVNGKLSYSYTFKADFPEDKDTVYYIHWYMETVNTIGSRGTIKAYDVKRSRPKPEISKTDGFNTIGAAPFNVTVKFDPAFDPATTLTESMFAVQGGSIISPIVMNIAGEDYTLTVQSSDGNNVEIRFPENRVKDTYNNWNEAATLPLTYSMGYPVANFSGIDSVYFADPGSVKFSVSSGDSNPQLYRNGGFPAAVDNASAASIVKVTKDGAPFTPSSVAFNDASFANEFTLTGLSAPGEYQIHIAADSIRNYVGNGIADTTYTFKVFSLGLSSGAHNFGSLHESYAPVAPLGVTVTNASPANVTATGLSMVPGPNDTAFVVSALAPTLPGGATTTFTVAPKTGLLVVPPATTSTNFTATLQLYYHSRFTGATFSVTFTVFKLAAPNAQIDFINETLVNLAPDTLYSINRGTPLFTDDNGATPIAETWMNGQASTNEAIEPLTGGRSIPQSILIPPRPAAPQNISAQDVTDTGQNNGEIWGVNDSMEYRQVVSGNEAWIPVPANYRALSGLSPGTYQIRYKAIVNKAFSSHILNIDIVEWNSPRIDREIMLPGIQGLVTLPPPGFHYVISGGDFTFTLTGAEVPPVVKTSRVIEGVPEELTGVPDGKGGYTYTIRQIRETVAIMIETVPVGNESIDGSPPVWAGKGHIRLRARQPVSADIYTVTGLLFHRLRTAEAAEVIIPAAAGVYLVRFADGRVHKVVVR
jgi:hypothetical protein